MNDETSASIKFILTIRFRFMFILACPCFGECYDGCEDCDNPICGGTNSCKNLELYIDYQVCKSIESEILGDCVTNCAGRFQIFSFLNYLL